MASAFNASFSPLSLEPTLVPIPEGWFWMGSEAGQDNERPTHRVWVDAFHLAAYQVTNREYEHFLRATASQSPPEVEWERAARGNIEAKLFPWGDAPPESLPDYATRWKSAPEPVGRYAPNAFGLYDISENVHEWCSDWYQADYYAISPERNPRGPETGKRRSSRGGSWRHHIKVTRCAARSSIPPEFHYADYGFRVACDL